VLREYFWTVVAPLLPSSTVESILATDADTISADMDMWWLVHEQDVVVKEPRANAPGTASGGGAGANVVEVRPSRVKLAILTLTENRKCFTKAAVNAATAAAEIQLHRVIEDAVVAAAGYREKSTVDARDVRFSDVRDAPGTLLDYWKQFAELPGNINENQINNLAPPLSALRQLVSGIDLSEVRETCETKKKDGPTTARTSVGAMRMYQLVFLHYIHDIATHALELSDGCENVGEDHIAFAITAYGRDSAPNEKVKVAPKPENSDASSSGGPRHEDSPEPT
jgi:hypothetical protein